MKLSLDVSDPKVAGTMLGRKVLVEDSATGKQSEALIVGWGRPHPRWLLRGTFEGIDGAFVGEGLEVGNVKADFDGEDFIYPGCVWAAIGKSDFTIKKIL